MTQDIQATDRDYMVRCLIDGVASSNLQHEAGHELERAWMAEARMAADLKDTEAALKLAIDALKRIREAT